MADEEEALPKRDPIRIRQFSDSYINKKNVVFAPINHEGLHNKPPSPPPKWAVSSPPSPPVPRTEEGCDLARKWVEQLGIRAVRAVSWVRNYWVLRRANWSFDCGASVAVAVLVWWVYVVLRRRQRRLRIKEQSRDHLVFLIKEKDEKIKQLLHQIALMNKLFLSLRKSS